MYFQALRGRVATEPTQTVLSVVHSLAQTLQRLPHHHLYPSRPRRKGEGSSLVRPLSRAERASGRSSNRGHRTDDVDGRLSARLVPDPRSGPQRAKRSHSKQTTTVASTGSTWSGLPKRRGQGTWESIIFKKLVYKDTSK